MNLVQQVLGGSAVFALMCALALLIIPLEQKFPRLAKRQQAWRHVGVIAAVACVSLAATLLWQIWVQQSALAVFVQLRVFSVSKLALPELAVVVIAFCILDLAAWLFHYLSHRLSVLWRLHIVHHADERVTAFSALLHHPLEQFFTSAFLLLVAVVFGVPVLVFIAYGLIVAVHAVVTHADIAIPPRLDRYLRWMVVTPDMHRIHHSQNMREGNSNFGSVFTVWDRLFRTYVEVPQEQSENLTMGLPPSQRPENFSVRSLLLLPFKRRSKA